MAFHSLKIVFVSTNTVDPYEMPRYVAFHLGLHCLPTYMYPVPVNKVLHVNIRKDI